MQRGQRYEEAMNQIPSESRSPAGERRRPFRQFDLNLLRTLDVLLEERNITHAASRMNVSQPAMSGALQRMRDFFGDPLLIRMGREMELTPLARSLVGPVRTTLNTIRLTLEAVPHFDPATAKRNFTIAMSDYAAFVMMPVILRQLSTDFPYISCTTEPISELAFAKLASNEIEFSISSDYWRGYGDHRPGPEVHNELLFEDKFVCVVDQPRQPAACVFRSARRRCVRTGVCCRLARAIAARSLRHRRRDSASAAFA